jgi:hypothetical protein
MPAPRRARTGLARRPSLPDAQAEGLAEPQHAGMRRRDSAGVLTCGVAATAVAAGLALAPLAAVGGPLREALAWVAALGVGLAAAAALRLRTLLAPALTVLLAEYAVALANRGGRVDAAAPLVAAGLLLYAELASWAGEARPRVRDEPPVLAARAATLTGCVLAALVLAALVLLAAALPAGGGLARLAVGVVAASGTLALVALVARPTATRPPRS